MDYVRVGIIVNTCGLKGEVKVKATTDNKTVRFKQGSVLYVDQKVKLVVAKHREYKGLDYLFFKDINDINDALPFKGLAIYAEVDESETNYLFQYIGMEVYNQADQLIGKVTDVWDNPAHLILVVNDKIYIPYVNAFIEKEDFVNKIIKVKLIEGME